MVLLQVDIGAIPILLQTECDPTGTSLRIATSELAEKAHVPQTRELRTLQHVSLLAAANNASALSICKDRCWGCPAFARCKPAFTVES